MAVEVPKLNILGQLVPALKRQPPAAYELVGVRGSARSVVALQAAQALGRSLLVITPGRIEAEGLYDDLTTFAGEENCALFPAWEVLPDDSMDPSDDIVAERMNTLKRLNAAQTAGAAMYVVAPLRAMLQLVVNSKRLAGQTVSLAVGDLLELDEFLEKLIKMGYRREAMVEARGEVSVRGGIVDIFPISSELPYRLELFGDEIESIRRFEPETQRSVDRADSLQVLPRSEKSMLSARTPENALVTLLNYFPKDLLVVLDEPLALQAAAEEVAVQVRESPFYISWEDLLLPLGRRVRLALSQVGYDATEGIARFRMASQTIRGWSGNVQDFWEQLKQWDIEHYTVQLLCVNSGERRRLIELIEEQGYRLGQGTFDLRVELGRLHAGFTAPEDKLAILSEREMFGRHYVRRKRRRFEAGTAIVQFSDLKSGDFIVHAEHGIGRYVGLRRFPGRSTDFLALQYAGGDTMYVPATHIDQVQKYAGGDGAIPKIDKLGGASWAHKKARVKKAVKDMTEELVKLYAAREQSHGHAFSPDTPWQHEFEDAFEYEETPDQARAILEVKRDMEAARPMDRLLCGDVGFGKTEVALRAAFKAVMDHKQVAVLAPTTVLAQQHYTTFSERLADYPVRVELLSRFRSAKEQKETVERLKSGEVDIVIGTHRIVSKDIQFNDLGLVVIDEEQRFGVAHKEKLKQLRHHVDVLTLTATPIPRTLHFSLIGIRDMSVINTAPNDRLPIHTCIEVWNKDLIQEAINREINRQGQVFFLHNRVQTIEKTAALVKQLAPRARVAFGHGQMPKHELEEVMSAFINRDIDVLVCTTIIGSGIDIPNANTIIMDRADMFGLSELYQIRGRVGRYKHRAFAYLLVPGDRALSSDAQQRLEALEEFSALGSGFRIAMRDLEIRGCGNILGAEQSGNIAAVGYETYKDLIAEAVAEQRGEAPRRANLPPFEVAVDAYIPDEYIPVAQQKMTLYRRIASVKSPDEVDELLSELQDRFGTPPGPVRRLLDIMRVRALAGEVGATGIVATKDALSISFESGRNVGKHAVEQLRHVFGQGVELQWQQKPSVRVALPGNDGAVQTAQEALKVLLAG